MPTPGRLRRSGAFHQLLREHPQRHRAGTTGTNRRDRAFQSPGGLMPRTVISGLVCITFLMLLEFSAVPQEPARKGADTESGQLTFNNACRTCHTTKEGDNRLGPNLHNSSEGKLVRSRATAIPAP